MYCTNGRNKFQEQDSYSVSRRLKGMQDVSSKHDLNVQVQMTSARFIYCLPSRFLSALL